MAKNTSLIHLATAFLAVIGGNAAVLTAYILIYPSITESSPSEYNMARSSDTAVTQSDVITDETTYTFPDTVQNTRTVPENQENIIADNTLLDRTVAEYFRQLCASAEHSGIPCSSTGNARNPHPCTKKYPRGSCAITGYTKPCHTGVKYICR